MAWPRRKDKLIRTPLRLALARLGLVAVVFWFALCTRLAAGTRLPIDIDEDDYLYGAVEHATVLAEGRWEPLMQTNFRPEHPQLAKLSMALALVNMPAPVGFEAPARGSPPAASLPQPHVQGARVASAVFGALEVLVLALISPLAGFLLAMHTFTVKYTSQVMLEAAPALAGALAVVAYERSRVWQRARPGPWLFVSASTLGLAAAGKYIHAVCGVGMLAHWLLAIRRSSSRRRSLLLMSAWGGSAILVMVVATPYLLPDPVGRLLSSLQFHVDYTRGPEVRGAALPPYSALVWVFNQGYWQPEVFPFGLDRVVGILAVVGFPLLLHRRSVYASWLVASLFFMLVWPTRWPQCVVSLTFPLALSARMGLVVIWRWLHTGLPPVSIRPT